MADQIEEMMQIGGKKEENKEREKDKWEIKSFKKINFFKKLS